MYCRLIVHLDTPGHGSKVNIESWLGIVGRKGCQKWSENDSLLSRHGESNDALGTRGYETITMQNDSLCGPICLVSCLLGKVSFLRSWNFENRVS